MDAREKIKILKEALTEARDHLEYCGYGDKWESECAERNGLEEKIEAALKIRNVKKC